MESSWFAQLLAADSVANWPAGVSSFMSVQAILHDADLGRSASAAVLRSHGTVPYFDWPTHENDLSARHHRPAPKQLFPYRSGGYSRAGGLHCPSRRALSLAVSRLPVCRTRPGVTVASRRTVPPAARDGRNFLGLLEECPACVP